MPKLKVSIDPDIDFGVVAWAEAFGFQAIVGIRRKKKALQGRSVRLTDDPIADVSSDCSDDVSQCDSDM